MLSVIIPSYKDPLLNKTVESIIQNFTGEFEVICVMDGYWQIPIDDKRVRVLHLGKNRGMRGAINAGVAIARGEYIMRTDEHCMFAKDFDKIMIESCEENWIVTAKRYFLDPINWKVMDEQPPVEHEKLVIQGGIKFSGQRWASRDEEQKDVMISETMAMQGSCWLMPHKWWDKVIGELQTEGYGPHYQDSHEMVFKTWQSGGKLMVNKNTWFAHKHRSFSRTHNDGTVENPANKEAGWKYSLDTWREYYEKAIRPLWGI
jgi:glycosyltransferase involved in cell wall biosynthesis